MGNFGIGLADSVRAGLCALFGQRFVCLGNGVTGLCRMGGGIDGGIWVLCLLVGAVVFVALLDLILGASLILIDDQIIARIVCAIKKVGLVDVHLSVQS